MSLVDFFTATYSATTTGSRAFAVPGGKSIPVGSLAVIVVGNNGDIVNKSAVDSKGNTWVSAVHGDNASSVIGCTLLFSRITTELVAADTITVTITSGGTANRWPFICAWFDDVVEPITRAQSTPVGASSNPVSSGSTGAVAGDRKLVLTAFGSNDAAIPFTAAGGATKVADVVTSQGSTERSVGLQYEYETSSSHTGTLNTATPALHVAMAMAMDATIPDPDPENEFGNSVTDDVLEELVDSGYETGSLRDRQMAEHVTAGRTTGSYADRCKAAGAPIFPK